MNNAFECRKNCGACCIAPSISSAIPNMPKGKPAGVPCIHLDSQYQCLLFGKPSRPKICSSLKPCHDMCGDTSQDALAYLQHLEKITAS